MLKTRDINERTKEAATEFLPDESVRQSKTIIVIYKFNYFSFMGSS